MDTTESFRNPVEELADEFMHRRRNGEAPTIEEYVERYPEHAAEIEDLFPALDLIEGVRDKVVSSSEAQSVLPTSGEQIGDYHLIRQIGRGGMGVVFEAQQQSLQRRVALKVLSGTHARDVESVKRFKRESRAAANLQHANIVPVFGVGEDKGNHYYVMQFVHGTGMDEIQAELRATTGTATRHVDATSVSGLASVLATGSSNGTVVDPSTLTAATAPTVIESPSRLETTSELQSYYRRIAKLGADIADGLAYAHEQGVLHRDIKPSNLLFDVTGNIWLTDFGLAKVTGEQNLTRTGAVLGTLRYMPPEGFSGKYDERGDVYGLGITLFEFFTREQIFPGENSAETMRQIREVGPGRLNQLARDLPRDLETVINKAIQRRPEDRYATAREFADDLQRFLRGEPVHARRVSRFELLKRWASRNKAVAALLTTVTLLLVSGLIGSMVLSARMSNLAESRRKALAQSIKDNSKARVQLVETLIRKAEALVGTMLPGQRTESLASIRTAIEIAREESLDESVFLRLRNAATSSLANIDIEPGRVVELTEDRPISWHVTVNKLQTHIAFQNGLGSPVVCRNIESGAEFSVPAPDPGNSGDRIGDLALSQSGKYLAIQLISSGQDLLQIWDTEREELLIEHKDLKIHAYNNEIAAINAAESLLACANRSGGFTVLSLPDGEIKWPTSSDKDPALRRELVQCVKFSPNGRSLFTSSIRAQKTAAGTLAATLTQFDCESWKAVRSRQLLRPANHLAISHDGLVAAGSHSIEVIDFRRQRQLCDVQSVADVRSLHFLSESILGIATHGRAARCIDVRTGLTQLRTHGQILQTFNGRVATALPGRVQFGQFIDSEVRRGFCDDYLRGALCVDPTSRLLLTSDRGGGLRVWDLHRCEEVGRFPCHRISDLQFTPSNHSLLLTYQLRREDKKSLGCIGWSVKGQKVELNDLKEVDLPAGLHPGHVDVVSNGAIAVSDWDSRTLARIAPDGTATAMSGVDGAMMFAAAHPNKPLVAVGCWEGRDAAVYDMDRREVIQKISCGKSNVTFSPDGTSLLCQSGIFDTSTWERHRLAPANSDLDYGWAFFRNDDLAVIRQRHPRQTIRVFDWRTWKPLVELAPPSEPEAMEPMELSPNGQYLIVSTSGDNGMVMERWDLAALREQLAELGLDWDSKPIEPAEKSEGFEVEFNIKAPPPSLRSQIDKLKRRAFTELRPERLQRRANGFLKQFGLSL